MKSGINSAGQRAMFQDLPEELLLEVVSNLSSREWAKARGSCRRFSELQPRKIALAPANMAMVRWCTSLWRRTSSIALHLYQLELSSSELSQILERGASQLEQSRITELHLEGLGAVGAECESMAWLDNILMGAYNLQRLILGAKSINMLPKFSHLQHVVLQFESEMSEQACSSLQGLVHLETISMKCTSFFEHSVRMPAIDLRGCNSLKAAYFDAVAPDAVVGAPQNCWTMIKCSAAIGIENWSSYSHTCAGLALFGERLPSIVLGPPCLQLTYLRIDAMEIGKPQAPVVISGAMPKLQYLELICCDLSVKFETALRPRVFKLVVGTAHELSIMDQPSFLERMGTLTLHVTNWSNPALGGLHAAFAAKLLAEALQLQDAVNDAPPHAQAIRSLPAGEQSPGCCVCGGACLPCLRKAGVLQASRECA